MSSELWVFLRQKNKRRSSAFAMRRDEFGDLQSPSQAIADEYCGALKMLIRYTSALQIRMDELWAMSSEQWVMSQYQRHPELVSGSHREPFLSFTADRCWTKFSMTYRERWAVSCLQKSAEICRICVICVPLKTHGSSLVAQNSFFDILKHNVGKRNFLRFLVRSQSFLLTLQRKKFINGKWLYLTHTMPADTA